jgi:hypothetical protein
VVEVGVKGAEEGVLGGEATGSHYTLSVRSSSKVRISGENSKDIYILLAIIFLLFWVTFSNISILLIIISIIWGKL